MQTFQMSKMDLRKTAAYLLPIILTASMLVPATLAGAETKVGSKQNIAGKTVHLGLPDHSCPMDPKNPADKMLIDGVKTSIKGSNELLMQFADCEELKNWRTGKQKYLNNFGSYQTSAKLKSTDLTGQESATVKEICNIFKKQGATLLKNIQPEVNRRIKDGFKNIRMNELKMLGIVHEDPTICAAATFQRLRTDGNTLKDQVNVYSVTFLNGRIVFTYLYGPYGEEQMVPRLTKTITDLNNYNQLRNNKKK